MQQEYSGKLIRVDLTHGTWRIEDIDSVVLRMFIGGSGLASYLLWKELKPGVDPLGPVSYTHLDVYKRQCPASP